MEDHYLKYLGESQDKNVIFHDLMVEFGEDVWNFAFFLTKCRDAADDISQDVFLAVYEKLFSFRGHCTVKSWLLTITRNKSLNYLNSSFIRKVLLLEPAFRHESSSSAEAVMFDRMETSHIWSAVMELPRKYREVIILNAHFLLNTKEMAELLTLSEGTVKSRLHRARKRISAALQQNKEGE
ncbi:RNA polymerase sigma factor [Paenibacillus eucommiae]|uniref:RNA polymerase sigma-70 factor (ECF subfamily) n=1 Tax=Paenibacillus eucommiae TaxID=1355755 RepID=A0ABS4IR77_9BACL|nr:sigma-70 family RNA polymerase sigma factor [Paenibacillus eucommiae]MBP1990069.1 RNA polymerase sigma-70 factor (ECF subfamily) [Paenibacillus eucommiae]